MPSRVPADAQKVILVVDDEPIVLNTVASILLYAGFVVLRAASPDEALRIAVEYRQQIDLILSDVVMPKLSGPDLMDLLGELHPESQRLFMAGFPDNPEIGARILGAGWAFLPKPFPPQVLLNKVHEILLSPPGKPSAASA